MAHELSSESVLKLISFVFWSALYIGSCHYFSHKAPEWCNRMVTLLHGSVATVIGLAQCQPHALSAYRLTTECTHSYYALMVWSWGYFAFDLLWCIIYWAEGALILCHHASALVSITVYMQKQYTGCTFACTLALMEISNPLLQARWLLRYEGYEKTYLYKFVEMSYLTTFFVARAVIGTYLLCKVLPCDIFDRDEKMISLLLYAVSVALLYDIFGFIAHKYNDYIVKY